MAPSIVQCAPDWAPLSQTPPVQRGQTWPGLVMKTPVLSGMTPANSPVCVLADAPEMSSRYRFTRHTGTPFVINGSGGPSSLPLSVPGPVGAAASHTGSATPSQFERHIVTTAGGTGNPWDSPVHPLSRSEPRVLIAKVIVWGSPAALDAQPGGTHSKRYRSVSVSAVLVARALMVSLAR